jgi:hypothetical protein
MFARSVPERINSFLLEHKDEPYCDSCIQQWLGLKWRQQVQLITATLSVTPSFRRNRGFCCSCKDHKQVIVALSAPVETDSPVTLGAAQPVKESIRTIFPTPISLPVTTSTAR